MRRHPAEVPVRRLGFENVAALGVLPWTMLLREHDLSLGTLRRPPTTDPSLQRPQLTVRKAQLRPPPQQLEDRHRLQAGLTVAEALRNVSYERADAEVHRFPEERFDVAISRFGTMFFADPVAAFANIWRAMRPNGRLVIMVWQSHDRNEWSVSIQRALTGGADVPVASLEGPDPFSLADPTAERADEVHPLPRRPPIPGRLSPARAGAPGHHP